MSRFYSKELIPTKRQIRFALSIADRLGINMPKEYTKTAYSKFISDNVEEYEDTVSDAFLVDPDDYGAGEF